MWVELQRDGNYPVYGQTDDLDEMLDKVIYINPKDTDTPIVPQLVEWDKAGYMHEGKPLGDHYPLMVTFSAQGIMTGVSTVQQAQHDDAPAYTVQGTKAAPDQKGLLITEGKKHIRK